MPLIKSIEPLSPASRAGLLPGDFILSVNGIGIFTFEELKKFVNKSNGDPLELEIFRNGITSKKKLSPENRPVENPDGSFKETMRIGIIGGFALEPERITPNIFEAIQFGYMAYLMWRSRNNVLNRHIQRVRSAAACA